MNIEKCDKIHIKGLHAFAYHGVHDTEKVQGQDFYINATMYVETAFAAQTDDLKDTVSYSVTAKLIYSIFTEEKYDLIETAAEKCAEAVLKGFPGVRAINIEVSKPNAPIGLDFETVSVDITRGWHTVYLGIGSNMGDKRAYIDTAVEALDKDEYIRVIKRSSIIKTAPYGVTDQDDFLNGALEIETLLSPSDLLDKLHEIEQAAGRERIKHWGPRTLDLDILLYDDLIINTENLTIPHVDMINRLFVLEPLNEIAPHLYHPVERTTVSHLLERLS